MEQSYNIKQLSLYILIILAILFIFYGITLLITNNKKEDTNQLNETEAIIDYEQILVKNIYNQKENEYYVFASTLNDTNVNSYTNSLSTYSELSNSLKIYTIDLDSAFNKKYVSEESNFEGQYPIFKQTTILKIKDKQITNIYEESEDITTLLDNLLNNEIEE